MPCTDVPATDSRSNFCRIWRDTLEPVSRGDQPPSAHAQSGGTLRDEVDLVAGAEPLPGIVGAGIIVEIGTALGEMHVGGVRIVVVDADQVVPTDRDGADLIVVFEPFELVQLQAGRAVY